MSVNDRRVMRVTLPVELVKQMDLLIMSGTGGYQTRTELIEDSLRQQVELPLTEAGGIEEVIEHGAKRTIYAPEDVAVAAGPATTALASSSASQVIPTAEVISEPMDEALFGLHNRDYPSLWAASFLRQQTQTGTVPLQTYLESVVAAAWTHAQVLLSVQNSTRAKTTALFPTNPAKKKAAEAAFRQFAIGGVRPPRSDGRVPTYGPLFVWQIAALTGHPDRPDVGLTAQGDQLLGIMQGLTVEEPHPPQIATTFLGYLREHASQDHRGFWQILEAVGPQGCDRKHLVEQMATAWPAWKDSELSTNTAGYVARAREWGLLRPRLEQGRYLLTGFGHHYLASNQSDNEVAGGEK